MSEKNSKVLQFLAENPVQTQMLTVPLVTLIAFPLVSDSTKHRDDSSTAPDVAELRDQLDAEENRQTLLNNFYRAVIVGVPLGVLTGLALTCGARKLR